METLRLAANGIHFHALASGPPDGPLVLLFHGFPDLAISWTPQLEALGAAGFRAVAPDLRGYGGTDKQGPFDGATLAQDVAGLVRALGREKATVVGHDWGGMMAWHTSLFAPEVLERLVVLNCPHPLVMARELLHNPRQLLASWYMLFFQLPWLPEWGLTRNGAAELARSLRGSFKRDLWTAERLQPHLDSFLQPGAAAGALGYYRAMFVGGRARTAAARAHPVAVPTLILWGVEDRFLGRGMAEPARMERWFAPGNQPTVRFIEGAGHFVHLEAAAEVSQALLDWLPPPR